MNDEIMLWSFIDENGTYVIQKEDERTIMYKVVEDDIDLRGIQIDEYWSEVNEREEIEGVKWGDKVAIVALDEEGKVVAGRVDRVHMGEIWTGEVQKTETGYKANIEGANIELPEGYSYKYILIDQLENQVDGRWIWDRYVDKKVPEGAQDFKKEIEFNKPQTMVVMVVDKDGKVRDVNEVLLNYIRVEIDMNKGTFIIKEAAELPEGYSYGYYGYNEGEEWWQEEGSIFKGKIIKVGEEVSAEEKEVVVVCIIKDGKLVRNVTGIFTKKNYNNY
ncbi:hypothetical protein PL321_05275 [Caloramator sp. mosi_1]|uniref:hypothetical protein n=1 Tax=Caloramator sp. mosi_1 TaxID=3023090 RepID=UPI00235F5060|nr:hypothetical protein [Caloramator sp. mosi_1]WDC84962.1 hypothetical protein PL321_05275 [Caloramator sp. mosi_1]